MFLGSSPYFLRIVDGFWWFSVVLSDSCFFIVLDGSWCCFGGSYQFLVVLDDSLLFLVLLADYWWFLVVLSGLL